MDDIMLEETQNAANDKNTGNAAKPVNRPKRRDGGRSLKSINGSKAKIEGDVAVGGSIYASEICIKQTNSDGTTEYVPLSDYIKQIVSAQQVVEPQVVFRRNAPRSNDSIGKIVAVAETVDEAKRVSYVATAEHVENFTVHSTKSVHAANNVENAGNVVRGITIAAADYVVSAANVEKIKMHDGHELRGPAVVPVCDCEDGHINVSEWNTYYRSKIPFITLDGLAKGWSDAENELVFIVEIQQQYNVLYNISISADCDVKWIGEDGSNMKFDGDILIEFRVRVGEIFARLI